MKNLQKFYDKKLQSLNPTRLVELPYLNHSQYDEPKLHFFAHILDLEAIINIDDISQWKFKELININNKYV